MNTDCVTDTTLGAGKSTRNEKDKDAAFMVLKLKPAKTVSEWCNKDYK